MQLSRRLEAVAGLVTPGMRLADIGTDHAYVPIWLVQEGKIPQAVAADINRGPLLRAQEHIRLHGLEGKITTRLSDGLDALFPGEAQSILIAGMGGALTVRILQKGLENGKLSDCRELILQPQSQIRDVRAWIQGSGWKIVREEMVFEDGKYYPVMKAQKQPAAYMAEAQSQPAAHMAESQKQPEVHMAESQKQPAAHMAESQKQPAAHMTEIELVFGPDLLKRRHPVLLQYLQYEERLQRRILESLKNGSSGAAGVRRQEVQVKLEQILEAREMFYGTDFPK